MTILTYLRSLWPFSKIKDDDLKESDKLLSELDIPDQTKRFMFALREPKTKSVVYVVCVQNLSERSGIDVDRVVRSIKPGAVVVVAKQSEYDDTVKLVGTDDLNVLPTSPLQVLKKCFLHRIAQTANDVGSSFLFLDLPAGYTIPASSSEVELETGRKSFGVQQLELITSNLIKLDSDQDAGLANIQSKDEYEAPRYALSLYALLRDLHSAFSEIPSIQHALPYAQKLLYDVSMGDGIDTQTVSGVFMFRVAIEGLRVRLNDVARTPLKTKSQPADVDFDLLSQEENAYAILVNMLHTESKKYNSLVVLLDASKLLGLRKHWKCAAPACWLIDSDEDELSMRPSISHPSDEERKLKHGVAVGAASTAIIGVAFLLKFAPAPSVFIYGPKAKSFVKAVSSEEIIRIVANTVIFAAERKMLNVMSVVLYDVIKNRRVRVVPYFAFGCRTATLCGLVMGRDRVVRAAEAVPSARTVASLGRGVEQLQKASRAVEKTDILRVQKSIDMLFDRSKRWKCVP